MNSAQLTNAIKVDTPTLSAKAIAIIRKATGLPISEIRQRAQAGDYLIEKKLSDDRALRSMIRLSENLAALGVETTLFQGGMPRSLDFMRNVYSSHEDTAREVGLED